MSRGWASPVVSDAALGGLLLFVWSIGVAVVSFAFYALDEVDSWIVIATVAVIALGPPALLTVLMVKVRRALAASVGSIGGEESP